MALLSLLEDIVDVYFRRGRLSIDDGEGLGETGTLSLFFFTLDRKTIKPIFYLMLKARILTVLSLRSSSIVLIYSWKVMGIVVLLILVIQGCFKASLTVYLCVTAKWVSRRKRFLVKKER